jgi:hypothetical protein
MLVMVVTAAVLNSGTLWSDAQPLNMLAMVVTAAVLNSGTLWSDEQPLNMLAMVVTAAVLNSGTLCNSRQPLNIFAIVVVLCETIVACSKNVSKHVCVPALLTPPNLSVVAFGADTATSSHVTTVLVDDLAECR